MGGYSEPHLCSLYNKSKCGKYLENKQKVKNFLVHLVPFCSIYKCPRLWAQRSVPKRSQTVRARGDGWLLGSRVHQMRQHQCTHELRDCDNVPRTCAGSNQTKSHHWEREVHKQPQPKEKLLAIDNCWGKTKSAFPV